MIWEEELHYRGYWTRGALGRPRDPPQYLGTAAELLEATLTAACATTSRARKREPLAATARMTDSTGIAVEHLELRILIMLWVAL